MNYYIRKFYIELENDRLEYIKFIKEQILFFNKFYCQYVLKNPKLCSITADIIKNLQKEYNAYTKLNRTNSANRKPIVWHKTGLGNKN